MFHQWDGQFIAYVDDDDGKWCPGAILSDHHLAYHTELALLLENKIKEETEKQNKEIDKFRKGMSKAMKEWIPTEDELKGACLRRRPDGNFERCVEEQGALAVSRMTVGPTVGSGGGAGPGARKMKKAFSVGSKLSKATVLAFDEATEVFDKVVPPLSDEALASPEHDKMLKFLNIESLSKKEKHSNKKDGIDFVEMAYQRWIERQEQQKLLVIPTEERVPSYTATGERGSLLSKTHCCKLPEDGSYGGTNGSSGFSELSSASFISDSSSASSKLESPDRILRDLIQEENDSMQESEIKSVDSDGFPFSPANSNKSNENRNQNNRSVGNKSNESISIDTTNRSVGGSSQKSQKSMRDMKNGSNATIRARVGGMSSKGTNSSRDMTKKMSKKRKKKEPKIDRSKLTPRSLEQLEYEDEQKALQKKEKKRKKRLEYLLRIPDNELTHEEMMEKLTLAGKQQIVEFLYQGDQSPQQSAEQTAGQTNNMTHLMVGQTTVLGQAGQNTNNMTHHQAPGNLPIRASKQVMIPPGKSHSLDTSTLGEVASGKDRTSGRRSSFFERMASKGEQAVLEKKAKKKEFEGQRDASLIPREKIIEVLRTEQKVLAVGIENFVEARIAETKGANAERDAMAEENVTYRMTEYMRQLVTRNCVKDRQRFMYYERKYPNVFAKLKKQILDYKRDPKNIVSAKGGIYMSERVEEEEARLEKEKAEKERPNEEKDRKSESDYNWDPFLGIYRPKKKDPFGFQSVGKSVIDQARFLGELDALDKGGTYKVEKRKKDDDGRKDADADFHGSPQNNILKMNATNSMKTTRNNKSSVGARKSNKTGLQRQNTIKDKTTSVVEETADYLGRKLLQSEHYVKHDPRSKSFEKMGKKIASLVAHFKKTKEQEKLAAEHAKRVAAKANAIAQLMNASRALLPGTDEHTAGNDGHIYGGTGSKSSSGEIPELSKNSKNTTGDKESSKVKTRTTFGGYLQMETNLHTTVLQTEEQGQLYSDSVFPCINKSRIGNNNVTIANIGGMAVPTGSPRTSTPPAELDKNQNKNQQIIQPEIQNQSTNKIQSDLNRVTGNISNMSVQNVLPVKTTANAKKTDERPDWRTAKLDFSKLVDEGGMVFGVGDDAGGPVVSCSARMYEDRQSNFTASQQRLGIYREGGGFGGVAAALEGMPGCLGCFGRAMDDDVLIARKRAGGWNARVARRPLDRDKVKAQLRNFLQIATRNAATREKQAAADEIAAGEIAVTEKGTMKLNILPDSDPFWALATGGNLVGSSRDDALSASAKGAANVGCMQQGAPIKDQDESNNTIIIASGKEQQGGALDGEDESKTITGQFLAQMSSDASIVTKSDDKDDGKKTQHAAWNNPGLAYIIARNDDTLVNYDSDDGRGSKSSQGKLGGESSSVATDDSSGRQMHVVHIRTEDWRVDNNNKTYDKLGTECTTGGNAEEVNGNNDNLKNLQSRKRYSGYIEDKINQLVQVEKLKANTETTKKLTKEEERRKGIESFDTIVSQYPVHLTGSMMDTFNFSSPGSKNSSSPSSPAGKTSRRTPPKRKNVLLEIATSPKTPPAAKEDSMSKFRTQVTPVQHYLMRENPYTPYNAKSLAIKQELIGRGFWKPPRYNKLEEQVYGTNKSLLASEGLLQQGSLQQGISFMDSVVLLDEVADELRDALDGSNISPEEFLEGVKANCSLSKSPKALLKAVLKCRKREAMDANKSLQSVDFRTEIAKQGKKGNAFKTKSDDFMKSHVKKLDFDMEKSMGLSSSSASSSAREFGKCDASKGLFSHEIDDLPDGVRILIRKVLEPRLSADSSPSNQRSRIEFGDIQKRGKLNLQNEEEKKANDLIVRACYGVAAGQKKKRVPTVDEIRRRLQRKPNDAIINREKFQSSLWPVRPGPRHHSGAERFLNCLKQSNMKLQISMKKHKKPKKKKKKKAPPKKTAEERLAEEKAKGDDNEKNEGSLDKYRDEKNKKPERWTPVKFDARTRTLISCDDVQKKRSKTIFGKKGGVVGAGSSAESGVEDTEEEELESELSLQEFKVPSLREMEANDRAFYRDRAKKNHSAHLKHRLERGGDSISLQDVRKLLERANAYPREKKRQFYEEDLIEDERRKTLYSEEGVFPTSDPNLVRSRGASHGASHGASEDEDVENAIRYAEFIDQDGRKPYSDPISNGKGILKTQNSGPISETTIKSGVSVLGSEDLNSMMDAVREAHEMLGTPMSKYTEAMNQYANGQQLTHYSPIDYGDGVVVLGLNKSGTNGTIILPSPKGSAEAGNTVDPNSNLNTTVAPSNLTTTMGGNSNLTAASQTSSVGPAAGCGGEGDLQRKSPTMHCIMQRGMQRELPTTQRIVSGGDFFGTNSAAVRHSLQTIRPAPQNRSENARQPRAAETAAEAAAAINLAGTSTEFSKGHDMR